MSEAGLPLDLAVKRWCDVYLQARAEMEVKV
jgi:hypothetical protein